MTGQADIFHLQRVIEVKQRRIEEYEDAIQQNKRLIDLMKNGYVEMTDEGITGLIVEISRLKDQIQGEQESIGELEDDIREIQRELEDELREKQIKDFQSGAGKFRNCYLV